MSKTIFLDSQFLIALCNTRDEDHAKAVELSQSLGKEFFLTTDAVLLEVGNALARNFKTQAIELIDELLRASNTHVVPLSQELFLKGLGLFKARQDKSWGLVDCISFEVMNESRTREALTNDQHFVQAGFLALKRKEG